MTRPTVRIRRTYAGLILTFPFNVRIVQAIKSLPKQARSFDALEREWVVGSGFEEHLRNRLHFCDIEYSDQRPKHSVRFVEVPDVR